MLQVSSSFQIDLGCAVMITGVKLRNSGSVFPNPAREDNIFMKIIVPKLLLTAIIHVVSIMFPVSIPLLPRAVWAIETGSTNHKIKIIICKRVAKLQGHKGLGVERSQPRCTLDPDC